MSAKHRRVFMNTMVFTIGLLSLELSAFGQGECRDAKGLLIGVVRDAVRTEGTVTNGGILNGALEVVFTGGPAPTPDPAKLTFTAELTLTTNRGVLKAKNVHLFDSQTTLSTVLARIQPTTSTGRFEGATGVLFISGKFVSANPFVLKADVRGEVCVAGE